MKINKQFFKQNEKLIHRLLIGLAIAIVIAVALEIAIFRNWYNQTTAIDRTFIVTAVIYFIAIHFIIDRKILYDFIYKKRYIIAFVILLAVVLLGYSGSSINMYDAYVPSQENVNTVILGKTREMRSDEWAVNTPLSFSQNMYEKDNMPYYSSIVRGTQTDMFTIIHAPITDILTLAKPFTIGYFFGNDIGLSFWWYGRLIALLLISFEFCMIITNKNKLVSLCGMLIIALAPAVQWWYSNFLPDLLIWGQLAIVLIDQFLKTDKLKVKILSAIGIFICAISYVFTFYPAWAIPFAYVFLAIFIGLIIQNRKVYHVNKRDILIILLVIIAVAGMGIRYYCISQDTLKAVTSTSYPGERFEIGGDGINNIFGYVYNIFMPYKQTANPPEVSTMISFYPIPFIVALIYVIRNKKGYHFIIPLSIVTILFTIWTFVETNEIFAKITLLFMTNGKRITLPLGIIQSYFIIYLLAHVKKEDKILKNSIAKVVALVATIAVLYIANKQLPGYMGAIVGFLAGLIVMTVFYLLLNLKEENKNKLIGILITIAIIGGIAVNPVIKGTDIIYEKPLAKKVQEIVQEDKEALWIVDGYNFPIPNYLTANGARVINSTNYYPNEELIYQLIGDKKEEEGIKEIYNRYAHISVNITNEDTELELMTPDHFKINMNYNKLKELNVKYVLSSRDLKEFEDNEIKFDTMYEENGFKIYHIIY